MIKSFKHKGLKEFFLKGSIKGIQAVHEKRLRIILNYLDEAEKTEDLNIPSFRLHKLKGDKNSLWSITVQANWQITFQFIDGNAYIVNYQDYH